MKYEFNIGGAIESVKSKEAITGSFGNVVNDIDYAATGNIAYVSYANGTETTNTYDSAQMYRLVNKRTASITGGRNMYLQDLSYTYDAVGNILTITDGNHYGTARGAMYSYDDLHRLVSSNVLYVTGSGPIVQTYEYDAIGNITHKSDVGDYLYQGNLNESYANPHAVTQIRSDADLINYEYDQNGNVLSAAGDRYEWDYNNRIVTITLSEGARPIEYGYDTSGMRVSVANDLTTTLYPNKGFNTDGQTVQKHIFAGDGLTATIKGAGSGASMSVAHTDHLGSTVAVTNAGGDVEELLDYHPFGEISYNSTTASTPEQRKYIGQEYDTDTELSYLEARYYDGHVGRFLSEDSEFINVGFDFSNPQTMNSYSYAGNNPINVTDPSGLGWWGDRYNDAKNAYSYVKQAVTDTWNNTVKPAIQSGYQQTKENFNRDIQAYKDFRQDSYNWQVQHPKATELIVTVGAAVGGGIKVKAPNGIAEVSPQLKTSGQQYLLPPEGVGSSGAAIPTVNRSSLPRSASTTLETLEANGYNKIPGYRGGRTFENRDNDLPYNADKNYYREWDIKPLSQDNRGVQRLLTGKGGESYFTNTHYGKEPGIKFYRVK